MPKVDLLYGRSGLSLSVPSSARILRGAEMEALPDPQGSLREALSAPIGCAPLLDLVRLRAPRRVAITVSDITRPVPNRLFLPLLFEVLSDAGVPAGRVTIVIGTGMHRPSTSAERAEILGPDIPPSCQVIDHRADAGDTLLTVGSDPPVRVCRQFAEADFRIVTGLIEPHFMAGFSGGRKGVCPALVDLGTVQRFHGVETLDDPRACNGRLAGNPCHNIALRIAHTVGVDFLLNVAIARDRRLAGVYCGDLEAAHEAGCRDVAAWTSATVDGPYDLVVTSAGGYPLDQTFYQAVKGMCTALPALGPASTLLQVSGCGEGLGSKAYTDLLLAYGRDWRRFLDDIRRTPETTRLDQWEFQMQCRVLDRIGVDRLRIVTDGIAEEIQRRLALNAVLGPGTVEERAQGVLDAFCRERPGARIAVVPEGPYTLLRDAGARTAF